MYKQIWSKFDVVFSGISLTAWYHFQSRSWWLSTDLPLASAWPFYRSATSSTLVTRPASPVPTRLSVRRQKAVRRTHFQKWWAWQWYVVGRSFRTAWLDFGTVSLYVAVLLSRLGLFVLKFKLNLFSYCWSTIGCLSVIVYWSAGCWRDYGLVLSIFFLTDQLAYQVVYQMAVKLTEWLCDLLVNWIAEWHD